MLLFFCFLKVVHLPSNSFLCPFVCYLISTLIGSPSQVLHSCFCYDPWAITIFPLPSSLLPSPVVAFPDVQHKQSVFSCLQGSGEHLGGVDHFCRSSPRWKQSLQPVFRCTGEDDGTGATTGDGTYHWASHVDWRPCPAPPTPSPLLSHPHLGVIWTL